MAYRSKIMVRSQADKIKKLEQENKKLKNQLEQLKSTKGNTMVKIIRSLSTALLVIVAAALINLSLVSFWVKNSIIDTDNWVELTTEIIESPSIRQDISNQLAKEIVIASDVKTRAENALPANASFLATPITSSVESFTASEINKIISSDKFQNTWQQLSKNTHSGIIASLENGGQKPTDGEYLIYINEDKLELNLQVVASKLQADLSQAGLQAVNNLNTSKITKTITLTEIDNMPAVLDAFNLVNKAARVLILLAIITFTVALLIANSKRRAGIALAIVSGLLAVSTVQAIKLSEFHITDKVSLASGLSNASSQALYEIITGDLLNLNRVLIAICLVAMLLLVFTGSTRFAKATRNTVRKIGLSIGQIIRKSRDSESRIPATIIVTVITLLILLVSGNAIVSGITLVAGITMMTWIWKPNKI